MKLLSDASVQIRHVVEIVHSRIPLSEIFCEFLEGTESVCIPTKINPEKGIPFVSA